MLGNVLKDAKYLKRIKDATDPHADPDHPRHHGIGMQAHHVISAEGVKKSGLGNDLVRFGYDINVLDNLVYIPSTLQGACHLGVQPHRGDHRAPVEGDGFDDDRKRPDSYHDMVKLRVAELERLLTDKCPAEDPDRRRTIRRKMDEISKKIANLIQIVPSKAPLTRIAKHFEPKSKIGCGGVDSIPNHSGQPCPVERHHRSQQGPGQKSEQIIYRKDKPYQLKVGR
ncbi:AHH domain-containing protein [Denitromonas iodatirespirans]|uniref:AHH domain-containing protein n=1 Tax=Denitromonas iodatirespirans TaxID=2795389 RepID=A0A944DHD0_DENI1|nr:AHH domain-containing protein [Denitromonas iodatirespirans]MBT0964172.1 AHH domain-containing protein [Denitromonas iodatirespirans]